jgi:peptide/nickel transport system permease protein
MTSTAAVERDLSGMVSGEPGAPSRKRRRFRGTPSLMIGVVGLALVSIAAIVIPMTGSGSADRVTDAISLPPSAEHLLGTDVFGRDMFMRAMLAARLSIVMTLAATALAVVVGIAVGTSIRLLPRRARGFCLRIVEIAVSYPSLLVAVVIAAILGPGPTQVVFAIGLAGIPAMARLASTLAAAVYEKDFVVSAQIVGVPKHLIITRHLLPNMAEPLLIQATATFALNLVAISALSFVGLGVQTPEYDLGRLLADGLPAIYSRPLEIVGPTVLIVLISLLAMLIGDGLAAVSDPRASVRRPRRTTSLETIAPVVAAPESLVSVQNLHVSTVEGKELVHGISFTIDKGEILGVVGESGSGKSLTAMSLAQLLPEGLRSNAAELRVGDLDLLEDGDPGALASTLAMVYQDPGTTFNPALRMQGQLTEVLRMHRGLSVKRAKTAIVDALAKTRIDDPERLLRSRPYELSGGMRQRAMIASALVADADLIIADEPTTALDVTVQAEILREFKRINQERAMSMLFISHDISVVEALCHRVIVMKDGEIVEELTADALREGRVAHPYTQSLLDALPRIDDVRKERS